MWKALLQAFNSYWQKENLNIGNEFFFLDTFDFFFIVNYNILVDTLCCLCWAHLSLGKVYFRDTIQYYFQHPGIYNNAHVIQP